MTQVYEAMKAHFEGAPGSFIYVVFNNDENRIVCSSVGCFFLTEKMANQIAYRCNETIDKEGAISNSEVQEIADKTWLECYQSSNNGCLLSPSQEEIWKKLEHDILYGTTFGKESRNDSSV